MVYNSLSLIKIAQHHSKLLMGNLGDVPQFALGYGGLPSSG